MLSKRSLYLVDHFCDRLVTQTALGHSKVGQFEVSMV